MFQARQVSAKFGSVELSQVLIPETSLLAQRPGGEEKFPLRLGLGRPFRSDEGTWACPVIIDGLYAKLCPVFGIDSWHALQLGNRLIRQLLTQFHEQGGRFFWADDFCTPLSLDQIWPELPA